VVLYFDPLRIRLDETYVTPGQTWSRAFAEQRYEPVAPGSSEYVHAGATAWIDEWSVVPLDSVLADPVVKYPRARFPEALCHRRVTRAADAASSVDRTFCYVRGVGKVYERTLATGEQEVLAEAEIPGCPAPAPR
jgi:hypothetical protein